MALDPFELSVTVIGFVLGLVALLGATSRDSRFGRRRIAKRLSKAADQGRSRTGAYEDVKRGTYRLKYPARFGHRFGSCYAITLLGDLALESSAEPAPDFLGVIAECLARDDPFVRHAAAASLFRLRPSATNVREQLARTAEQFPNKSSGELAKRTVRPGGYPAVLRANGRATEPARRRSARPCARGTSR